MSWLISLLVASLISTGVGDTQTITPPQTIIKANYAEAEKAVAAERAIQDSRIDQTYPLNSNGRVSLSNINGKVDVEAWDRNEVRVEATKRIQCEKPEDIEVAVDANPNWVRIETKFGKDRKIIMQSGDKNQKIWSSGYDNRCSEHSVDYKLTVPRNAQLDEIETVNGNVTLSGMSNLVKSSTVNGKVTARNLRGSVNISTVNGTLDVGFDSLENVREIKINLVHGTANLQLPSDVDAVVRASTVHGAINNDFNLPVKKGEYVGNNLYGKLGEGRLSIRLNSVNGELNIRRNQDGKTPQAVVNMLSQIDEESFDESNSGTGVRIRTPRPPKPPRLKGKPNVIIVPTPPEPPTEGVYLDEKTREEIRKAIRESKKAADAVIINKEEIRRAAEEAARFSIPPIDVDLGNAAADGVFALSRRQSGSVTVDGTPNLKIDAANGAVRIRGWDKPEVSFGFVQQSGLDEFKPSLEKNGSDVRLKIPDSVNRYRLEVYVPRKTNVKIVSNGEIRVEGINGKLELDGENGAIDVRDAGGDLTIAAQDARVRVIGFDGLANVKTVDGDIALEGNFTALSTQTVDGETILTLNKDVSATLEATTKNVTFEGIEPDGAPKDAKNSIVWKIGGGSASYKLKTTADGQIYIRSAANVRILRNNYALDLSKPLFG